MGVRLAAVPVLIALILAGCGGGDDDAITEGSLRDCLADQGLRQRPEGSTPNAPLFNLSPDFRMQVRGGGSVGLLVEGSDEKARRRAADIRGSLQTLGIADPDSRLVARRNVIAVFERAPTSDAREAVASCLD
jgi:hypothetical protein